VFQIESAIEMRSFYAAFYWLGCLSEVVLGALTLVAFAAIKEDPDKGIEFFSV